MCCIVSAAYDPLPDNSMQLSSHTSPILANRSRKHPVPPSKWIRMNIPDWREAVVVSKNPGGTKRVTSLADALQLSFGVVTTDRRRSYYPASLNNSVIIERIGTDGTNELEILEEEVAEADVFTTTTDRATVHQDFAEQSNHVNGDSHSRRSNSAPLVNNMPTGVRARLMNGDFNSYSPRAGPNNAEEETTTASSGLYRTSSAGETAQPHHDEDGYEVSDGEGEADEVGNRLLIPRTAVAN